MGNISNFQSTAIGLISFVVFWVFCMLAKDLARKGHGYFRSTLYTMVIMIGVTLVTFYLFGVIIVLLGEGGFLGLLKFCQLAWKGWMKLGDYGIPFFQYTILLGCVLFSLVGAHFGVQQVIREE